MTSQIQRELFWTIYGALEHMFALLSGYNDMTNWFYAHMIYFIAFKKKFFKINHPVHIGCSNPRSPGIGDGDPRLLKIYLVKIGDISLKRYLGMSMFLPTDSTKINRPGHNIRM